MNMEILVKDGVKYTPYNFQGKENEFELIIFSNFKQVFGDNTIIFSKQKIKTSTEIGTIPDGFAIDFKSDKWYIIEVELSCHDVYSHIVPQLTKFSSALKNIQTRKLLIKAFENEINTDPFKNALLTSNGKKEIFKSITEIVDKSPELVIFIEKEHKELNSVFSDLPFKTRINIFKVFTRHGFGLGDEIHLIEPICNPLTPNINILETKIIKKESEISLQIKRGRGDSDVLVDQIIPVIKLIIKNGKSYYSLACKEVAKKINTSNPTINSNCTRKLGLNGRGSKEKFLEHIENRTIKDLLKKIFSNRHELIDKEL